MFSVFGFYKFQKINNLKKNQKILNNLLVNKNIYGSIIVSKEGLNGSISGKNKDIKATIIKLKKIFSIKEFDSFNNSKSKFKPSSDTIIVPYMFLLAKRLFNIF